MAEQLGDVVRTGPRGDYCYQIADAPGKADEGPAARPSKQAQIRTPRSSRQVTPQTIGRAGTEETFDEFAINPEIDRDAVVIGIRSRRVRLRRHNLLVQKLAARLARAGGQMYEMPFDALVVMQNAGLLVEVKTLDGTETDERDRVRDACAQLLYYHAFLLPALATRASIRLIACFERQITDDHVRWLNQQNIAVIWEQREGFAGDALATNFLGRYLEELR